MENQVTLKKKKNPPHTCVYAHAGKRSVLLISDKTLLTHSIKNNHSIEYQKKKKKFLHSLMFQLKEILIKIFLWHLENGSQISL